MRAARVVEMDVQDMRIFARVAAVQNLSSVGTEMNLTPGTISKRIQALEDDLGAKLFNRNTRSIHITEEGRKLLEYVERILDDIEGARAAIGANIHKPKGKLRVAAPISLGEFCIAPAICQFVRSNPEIDIEIDLTDRPVNLQEEGYDVVIRRGTPPNSGLIRKALSPDPQIIVASPAYLAKRGIPSSPEDLATHSCLVHAESPTWEFERKNKRHTVRVTGRLKSDNADILRFAAIDGIGIARISKSRSTKPIRDGSLRRVLSSYEVIADSTVFALYPAAKHVLPKLRVFLNFLGDWFRGSRAGLLSAGPPSDEAAVALGGALPQSERAGHQ